jgi:alkylated DNA nucleotide flippase Atl1
MAGRTEWERRTEAVIANLAVGEIVSYVEVARRAGRPRAARSVGSFLSRYGAALPWWRVVHADGRLAAHKGAEHARRLRSEGVEVRADRVIDAIAR